MNFRSISIRSFAKLRFLLAGFITGLLAFSIGISAQPAIELLDHTLAKDVDEETLEPIDRTSEFLTTGERINSWIKVGPITGVHTVTRHWLFPNGTLYFSQEFSIGETGETFNSWTHWAWIVIEGFPPEDTPGQWQLHILLDGKPLVTERFTIVAGERQTFDEERANSGIFIKGNADFTPQNGVTGGTGTEEDPFIIDGVVIDDPNLEEGVHLENTSAYVVIRNCEVRRARFAGISFRRAFNATIENCRAAENQRGFNISRGRNIKIIDSTAEFNREVGFVIFGSESVELRDNKAWYNWEQTLEATSSWGFFADEDTITLGQNNLSVGHNSDVRILRASDTGDEADRVDIFASLGFTPEESCTQILNKLFLFVGRSDDAPLLNEPIYAELLSILRSLPTQMRGQINQFLFLPDQDEFIAQFTGLGTVRLFDIKHLKDFSETVFHEIGHVLQDRLFDDGKKSAWLSLHRRSGQDSNDYAISFFDNPTRRDDQLLSYGMIDQFEDFATLFQAYTRDTQALIHRAKHIEATTGKTILREKIAFVASLFQGQTFAYRQLMDWDSTTPHVNLRLQRAPVQLDNGIPIITDDLSWEEF